MQFQGPSLHVFILLLVLWIARDLPVTSRIYGSLPGYGRMSEQISHFQYLFTKVCRRASLGKISEMQRINEKLFKRATPLFPKGFSLSYLIYHLKP